MEKKHKGAWAELVACGWLLNQGYEVYRNVSPHGLCDVLATRDGAFIKFDVKIIRETVVAQLSRAQTEGGVLLLGVYPDGRCVISPARPDHGMGTCKECGTTFKKTQHKNCFCQKSCTIKYWGKTALERRRTRLTNQHKPVYAEKHHPEISRQPAPPVVGFSLT